VNFNTKNLASVKKVSTAEMKCIEVNKLSAVKQVAHLKDHFNVIGF
jgi:hypothetical protein